jgi:cold shock CspA family protein
MQAPRRKPQDHKRERQGVETHAEIAHGHICEIHPDKGFGRIETQDGRIIYFHKSSVLEHPFAELTAGTEVSFAESSGDHGPQASTVHVIA